MVFVAHTIAFFSARADMIGGVKEEVVLRVCFHCAPDQSLEVLGIALAPEGAAE